jgi:hypothetical protein
MRKLLTFFIALGGGSLRCLLAAISQGLMTLGGRSVAAASSSSCTPGPAGTNFLARASDLGATGTNVYCVMING